MLTAPMLRRPYILIMVTFGRRRFAGLSLGGAGNGRGRLGGSPPLGEGRGGAGLGRQGGLGRRGGRLEAIIKPLLFEKKNLHYYFWNY